MAPHSRLPLQTFVACALALIVPRTLATVIKQDLVISNKVIAPDGFSRSYVVSFKGELDSYTNFSYGRKTLDVEYLRDRAIRQMDEYHSQIKDIAS